MNATMIRDNPNRTALAPRPRVRHQDFGLRKKAVPSSRDDVKHVRLSSEVLGEKFEAMLEAWYRFLGSNPLVLCYFTKKSYDRPDAEYLAAVRKAFGQWIVESGDVESEQNRLGELHDTSHVHSAATNWTESAEDMQRVILGYVLALLYPVTPKQKLHQAWVKSVIQETLVLAVSAARDDYRKPTVQSALVG